MTFILRMLLPVSLSLTSCTTIKDPLGLTPSPIPIPASKLSFAYVENTYGDSISMFTVSSTGTWVPTSPDAIPAGNLAESLVAPELKAHTVKLDALQRQYDTLQKQAEVQHDSIMKTIDAFRAEMRSEFAALRAANQMEVLRQLSPISERVAVVEERTR